MKNFLKLLAKFSNKFLLSLTLIGIFAGNLVEANSIHVAKAATGNKYGFVKKFQVPKKWRGQWYKYNNKNDFYTMRLYAHGLVAKSTYDNYVHSKGVYNPLWVIGKIKGKNKYPWQMPLKWVGKNNKGYTNNYAGYWVKRSNREWIVETSPLTKLGEISDYRFLSLHSFKVKDKKYYALLGSGEDTEKVYFETKKLAKKFSNYNFNNIKRPLR